MAYLHRDPLVGAQPFANTETTAKHTLGATTQGKDVTNNGGAGTFIYVQASSSITQYDAVAIKHGYKAAQLTITNAKTAIEIAFSQVAVGTKGDYFWAMQGGRPIVRCALGTQPDVPLFATATGGVLDDVSSSVVIQGVMAVTQVTNSAGTSTCVARFPTAHHEPPG